MDRQTNDNDEQSSTPDHESAKEVLPSEDSVESTKTLVHQESSAHLTTTATEANELKERSGKKYPRTLEVQIRSNGKTETRTRTLSVPSTCSTTSSASKSPLASPRIVHHGLPDLNKVTPRIDNKMKRIKKAPNCNSIFFKFSYGENDTSLILQKLL